MIAARAHCPTSQHGPITYLDVQRLRAVTPTVKPATVGRATIRRTRIRRTIRRIPDCADATNQGRLDRAADPHPASDERLRRTETDLDDSRASHFHLPLSVASIGAAILAASVLASRSSAVATAAPPSGNGKGHSCDRFTGHPHRITRHRNLGNGEWRLAYDGHSDLEPNRSRGENVRPRSHPRHLPRARAEPAHGRRCDATCRLASATGLRHSPEVRPAARSAKGPRESCLGEPGSLVRPLAAQRIRGPVSRDEAPSLDVG